MAITLSLKLGDALKTLTTVQGNLTNLAPPLTATKAVMLQAIDANFAAGGRPAWQPLAAPRTGIRPLSGRNVLRNSFTGTVESPRVWVETQVPYAGIHQYGGVVQIPEIVPRRARALRWVSASGKVVFARRARAHSIHIPARPFLQLTAADEEAIRQIFTQWFTQGVT